MKNAMKKLLSLTLAVMLLLSVVPFQAFAATNEFGEMVFNEEYNAPAAQSVENNGTQAVVTDSDNAIAVFALPGDLKVGDKATVYFHVDGEVMKKTETKVGAAFPALPSGKDTLDYFAKTNGTSAGYAFKFWSWEEDGAEAINTSGLKVGGDKNLQESADSPDAKGNHFGEMHVYAVFEEVEQTSSVKLDPKSGKFAPGVSDTIQVSVGKDYPVEDMPTPTRSGYTFLGWFVKEDNASSERCLVAATSANTPSEDLSVRSATAKPYAKWEKTGMTVSVKWYDFDNGDWTDFTVNGTSKYAAMAIPADSKLSASTGSFPSDSEINWLKDELPDGYSFKGWKFLSTGKEFKAGSTAVTAASANSNNEIVIVPKLQRNVKLVAQHPTKNLLATQDITVEIGEKIGKLPAPASWAGDTADSETYTFTQWVGADDTVISTRENLDDTSKHPVYYPTLSDMEDDHSARYPVHFHAEWAESKVVQLYFHVDGKTSTYAKKVSCYDIPASGSFNMHSLNLYKYFPDYTKYDDGVDVQYGWYTDAQWKNYCTGKPASTVCDELWNISDTADLQELHIMLIDKGNDPNTYNNNNKTADKTNPKTGDIILAAVAIMVVSAAALAGVYYICKRKRASK